MGAAAPSMMTMSIAPFEAQKRAQNLGIAESAAVTYAAQHEGATQLSPTPRGCGVDRSNSPAIEITCTEGKDTQYVQSVSRSFRLDPNNAGSGNNTTPPAPTRTFPNSPPSGPFTSFSMECNAPDLWGLNWSTTWPTLDQCVPKVAWTKSRYLESHPDDWLFDINNHNGWGSHPDY